MSVSVCEWLWVSVRGERAEESEKREKGRAQFRSEKIEAIAIEMRGSKETRVRRERREERRDKREERRENREEKREKRGE